MAPGLKTLLNWAACALLILIAGCASTSYAPEFTASEFSAQDISEIVVLSVIDHRADTNKEIRLDKWTKKIVKKMLKKKRFTYSFEPAPQFVQAVSPDGLTIEDPEMIASLGPENSRWLLLFVLHDARTTITLGATGKAEMTGYIIDKDNQSSGATVSLQKQIREVCWASQWAA